MNGSPVWTNIRRLLLPALCLLGQGCVSSGRLGIVVKSSVNPAALVREGRAFDEIGPARGRACRYSLLGIIPWGNADVQAAVDKALRKNGGDALINVTTSNGLYGFVLLYNLFSYTCTEVKGTAIKFR